MKLARLKDDLRIPPVISRNQKVRKVATKRYPMEISKPVAEGSLATQDGHKVRHQAEEILVVVRDSSGKTDNTGRGLSGVSVKVLSKTGELLLPERKTGHDGTVPFDLKGGQVDLGDCS